MVPEAQEQASEERRDGRERRGNLLRDQTDDDTASFNLDRYKETTIFVRADIVGDGNKRDQSCLNRDLVMLKQLPHETAQKFYDKCLEILNLLCGHVDAHETAAAAAVKRDLYQKVTLKTFLSGLRKPLGTVIRPPRPFTNSQVFGKTPVQQNVFKSYPNRQFPKPTPMSLCTKQSHGPNKTAGPSQQYQPKFAFQELYNTETDYANIEFENISYEDPNDFYENSEYAMQPQYDPTWHTDFNE
ncbi:hypothetical protein HUJ05_010931 [Dendroctonus ponderosae]|nr:hypothetical protein HUJ05_010931 [Dendroctonus ponderosae]